MADRKATNKYYPPEWDPSKGSINTFRGSHPLRERARKLDQGIMIIRFELPYNIWCGGCGSHVGMGVRYNAEKTTVGKYYSTPIFKFRMKCHLCDNHFEIQTDPKNMDYVVVSGASRKNEKWEHVEGETVSVEGKTEAEKLATDPMYRLEHGVQDQKKAEKAAPNITKILELQQQHWDDSALNSMLRKNFREEKAQLKEKADIDKAFKKRAAIDIDLVEEQDEDVARAKRVKYGTSASQDKRLKRLQVKAQPVLSSSSSSRGSSGGATISNKQRALLLGMASKNTSTAGKSSGRTQEIRTSLGIKQKQ